MDLSSALNVKTSDIERPPVVPVGIYRAAVKGPAKEDKRKEYEFLEFQMQLIEPLEGVDPDAIRAYGALGPQSVIRYSFVFNGADEAAFNRTLFNLKQFLTRSLGIEDTGQSLKEHIMAAVGRQCQVQVRWRPDPQDPEIQYAEIGKTAAL